MRTAIPVYPIVVSGITLQVGAYAQVRAWELRGRQPITYLYYPAMRETYNAEVGVTAAPPLLNKLNPNLRQALDLLRNGGECLDLRFIERARIKECVGHLRSMMGSNNYKLLKMLETGRPYSERAALAAYDAEFVKKYEGIVTLLSNKGLNLVQVEAFMNSTPYHEDEVIIHTDDQWRIY